MKPSWIIWTGPKSNDKCPYQRHTEEDCAEMKAM